MRLLGDCLLPNSVAELVHLFVMIVVMVYVDMTL